MRIGAGMIGAQVEVIPGLGHAMMLEAGWRTVADRVIEWLRALRVQREG
jgi:pimeloyl-ACP methyl ester carboxylesterase